MRLQEYVTCGAKMMLRRKHKMLDGTLTSTLGSYSPPAGPPYETHKVLIIGNGESRSWFKPCHQAVGDGVVTWGCNALYRDGAVHHLVAVDYGMQQEIYDSGYCLDNPEYGDLKVIHFANWNVVPAEIAEVMFMGYDIPEAFIHRSKNRTDQCVISGKDPNTLHEKIEVAMRMNPGLDTADLKLKMEKDVGVWITYVEPNDDVVPIQFPIGWSTGNTALHLACQSSPTDAYVLGYDLSSYDKPLNNIYKGTDNYLPADTKGFSPDNWYNQMQTVFKEFPEIKFHLTDCDNYFVGENVKHITKEQLCWDLKII